MAGFFEILEKFADIIAFQREVREYHDEITTLLADPKVVGRTVGIAEREGSGPEELVAERLLNFGFVTGRDQLLIRIEQERRGRWSLHLISRLSISPEQLLEIENPSVIFARYLAQFESKKYGGTVREQMAFPNWTISDFGKPSLGYNQSSFAEYDFTGRLGVKSALVRIWGEDATSKLLNGLRELT